MQIGTIWYNLLKKKKKKKKKKNYNIVWALIIIKNICDVLKKEFT